MKVDVVYLQAKRWDTATVGEPIVRDFVGSLEAQRAKRHSIEYQLSYNGWNNSALSLGFNYLQMERKHDSSFSLDYKIYF